MDRNPMLDEGSPRLVPQAPPLEGESASSLLDSARPTLRFPAPNEGSSLTEMAQRDLNATLQLLAERAQYITGASGAAIALWEGEKMVCRASAGPSAPELGTRLQIDSGLSGESVRTKQILRCDDAEHDARVNRESCHALGIASVMVMPLIGEQEVNGVFELFSGRPYAFEERDVVALERMAGLIQTAVEHADAAKRAEKEISGETLEEVKAADLSAPAEKIEHAPKAEGPVVEPEVVVEVVPGLPNVAKCEDCGFPISEGRGLCVACEAARFEQGGISSSVGAAFLSQYGDPKEGWWRAHQYLIGMILVTAVTVAVLVWLR
ncbi:MAG TPA: GAF domain-containing protein [Terriglobales bacterium]|nr:GAF domain-containing protein [Terriglobales bacterium]